MRIKLLAVFLLLSFLNTNVFAQTLADSVNFLYTNYNELAKSKERYDALGATIKNFENKFKDFNSILESNNAELKRITNKQLFSLQSQQQIRANKIINTSEFVFAANTSLNSINLFDALTKYLDEVSKLNNPNDSTLGFSLSTQIQNILNTKIIKGKSKLNAGKTSKFVAIVENIIKSPVVETFATAVPVVNSIKSVIDLVIGTATRGKDIDVADVIAFKTDLKVYVEHYEGLSKAQDDFSKNLNSLDVRKSALMILLASYTKERINTVTPNTMTMAADTMSTTQIINTYYYPPKVKKSVDNIVLAEPANYEAHLNDNRMFYPEYALSQAKFIKDEISSLSKEYLSAFESYQKALDAVLSKSSVIGNKTKIENTSTLLNQKLLLVKKVFEDGVNLPNLNQKFADVAQY